MTEQKENVSHLLTLHHCTVCADENEIKDSDNLFTLKHTKDTSRLCDAMQKCYKISFVFTFSTNICTRIQKAMEMK